MKKPELLPLTFRKIQVDQILTKIKAGDSSLIIGIGSVGKSNLLRFIQQEDVRRAKLGQEWNRYLFVYVDVNKMLQQSDWGLFELMLHQILIGISQQDIDLLIYETIDDLHQRATEPATQHLALRYLERALALVCNRLDLSIVFLIDEFDILCSTLSAQTFAALRSLRDDYKYRLTYVVAARKEISRLRRDIESFEELVAPNTIWLASYSKDDALQMLRRLESRHNVKLDEKRVSNALVKTSGHPGLLRAIFPIVCKQHANLDEALARDRGVHDECQRIWNSLDEGNQRAMANLASETGHRPPPEILQRLQVQGLVGGPWADSDAIFSSLLADYICREKPSAIAHIFIDHQQHIVWVDERKVEKLAPLEYKLIEYLDTRRGDVCTRDEIIANLYPDQKDSGGVSDASVDAILKRLRKAIESRPDQPRFILTMRGHGIKLADGETIEKRGGA
jgi:DNA-binding winged helix-turn-helix (wHTH) protein